MIGIEHAQVMGHALGINVYHAIHSKKKKDKKLPKEYYRNRFCAGEGHDDMLILLELHGAGYMERGQRINDGQDTLWYVTDEGKRRFEILFNEYVNAR